MPTVIIRRAEVMRRVGFRRSKFDDLRKLPDFPKPVYITARTPGWVEHEIEAWIQARIASGGPIMGGKP